MPIHLILPMVLGLMFAGCAANPVPNSIFQDKENMVRLEAHPQGPDLQPEDTFQHPLELTEEELTIILQSLRVQKRRGFFRGLFKQTRPASVRAFSEEEARKMAGPLSTALARVTPHERIAFLFTHPRGRVFKDVTSGVLFAKADRLYLILGRYRAASRPHEKDIRLSDPVLPKPPYTGFRLAAGPYQALVASDESPIWKEPVGIDHWVMINYRELLSHPPEPEPFPVLSESSSDGNAAAADQDSRVEIKEKLRLLKELRDENLISEEEYEKKRQELLKEF